VCIKVALGPFHTAMLSGLQISSRFGSTYICEKAFSTLTYVKNKYRSSLTAPHISDLMLLSTSDLSQDIEKLLANKSLHRSH